jgi:cytochrome c peroxidase
VIFRLARVPLAVLMLTLASPLTAQQNPDLLGLPELPVPADNPITKEKAVLGERLFNDKRFSSTGKISCATCHDPKKGFTDNLRVSKGINGLTGTRNSPTVANAAFNQTQFWDGRSPSLEEQSQHPIVNPVEMGLANHDPVMKIVREDKQYIDGFKAAFNVEPAAIQLDHVLKAIATFERTVIDGNSRFDRWYYGGQNTLIFAASTCSSETGAAFRVTPSSTPPRSSRIISSIISESASTAFPPKTSTRSPPSLSKLNTIMRRSIKKF